MANSLLVLVVACYAAVATAYLEARRRREPPPGWSRWAGAGSVGAHLLGLVLLGAEMGRSPFASGAQSLSFVAFALAALYVVLEATSRVATHGGGFWAVAAVLSALSVPGLLHGTGVAPGTVEGAAAPVRDTLRTVHVGLSLLSAAAVFAGGLLALGYLGAYRRVKRRALEAGEEGPSLSGFERLERRAAGLSVLLLLPALLLGTRVALLHERPATVLPLVLVTGVLLGMLGLAGFLWWRRPLKGRLAAVLHLLATGLLLAAVLLAHPWAVGGAR